jgi:NADH-quinone oxidoreductase subunit N
MRWLAVAPELALAAALLVAFGAVLAAGERAGRVARGAWLGGAVAALIGAAATAGAADDFLFAAYRVDAFTQYAKGLVLAGAVLAALAGRGETGAFGAARATAPFLRLAAVTTLVAAASAADLLLLWVLFELVAVAHVTALATEGRWSTNERAVRRLVAAWLPTSLVLGLGVMVTAARMETTRFVELEGAVPPLGVLLVLIALLARAGLAPLSAAVALARAPATATMPVLAGSAGWVLAVAVATRVATLGSEAPAAWAGPALVALAAVPAALAVLALARPASGARPHGQVVRAALAGAAIMAAAAVWAPYAARALP